MTSSESKCVIGAIDSQGGEKMHHIGITPLNGGISADGEATQGVFSVLGREKVKTKAPLKQGGLDPILRQHWRIMTQLLKWAIKRDSGRSLMHQAVDTLLVVMGGIRWTWMVAGGRE